MSYLANNWYWIVAAAASAGGLAWLQVKEGGLGNDIAAPQAVMLMNREKAVVIDLSEPGEFAKGRIKGAKNIPFGQIAEGAKGLPSKKDIPLIVVCPTGARAGKAAQMLRKFGFSNVQVLRGGLRGWREANLPTEASE